MATNGNAKGTAGAMPIDVDLSDSMNATSSAGGGRISNGMIFNTAGGSFGLVKMLALSGVALIALKIFMRRK